MWSIPGRFEKTTCAINTQISFPFLSCPNPNPNPNPNSCLSPHPSNPRSPSSVSSFSAINQVVLLQVPCSLHHCVLQYPSTSQLYAFIFHHNNYWLRGSCNGPLITGRLYNALIAAENAQSLDRVNQSINRSTRLKFCHRSHKDQPAVKAPFCWWRGIGPTAQNTILYKAVAVMGSHRSE